MSKLLFDQPPLLVQPELATRIGLNEALFLQQLNYWIKSDAGQYWEGRKWVYNTYAEWQKNFPFWSTRTIQGIVLRLENEGIIEATDAHNNDSRDRTKWYTINYGHPDLYDGGTESCAHGTESNGHSANFASSSAQNSDPHSAPAAPSTVKQRLLTETTSKTNTAHAQVSDDFALFWDAYPRKIDKQRALTAWKKLNPRPELVEIIVTAVIAQTENNWRGTAPKYIPHPTTWLNGSRWLDAIEAPSSAPSPNGVMIRDKHGNLTGAGLRLFAEELRSKGQ